MNPAIDTPLRRNYHIDMKGGVSVIIDSHAHYNNNAYKKPFRYLSYDKDGYALKEGEREQLFQALLEANIPYSIGPDSCRNRCTLHFALLQGRNPAQTSSPRPEYFSDPLCSPTKDC